MSTSFSQTILTTVTAATSVNSSASNEIGAGCKYVALQLNATSLNAADGTIAMQDSLDGSNWSTISGASITVASGTSVNMIRNTAFTGKFIRAVWTKGSNSAGTIEVILMFKS